MKINLKKAVALMAVVMVLALTACSSGDKGRPELLEPAGARPESAMVERRDLSDLTLYSGQLVPDMTELSFDVDGYISGIFVNAGDVVSEGDVLAAITGKDYRTVLALEDEIAELRTSTQEELKELEAELELERLAGRDTSESELKLKHRRETARLEIELKEKRLEELKENDPGYRYITAPCDCTVTAAAGIGEGTYVAAGTPLVALDCGGGLTLTCDYISESEIASAYSCYALINGAEYELGYIAYSKEELRDMAAREITPVSRFTVLKRRDGSGETREENGYGAGDYAAVILISDMHSNVLVVPRNAVYSDTSGKFVYEIVDNARVKRNVVTGISDSAYVEITEGLGEGAVVYVKN